MGSVIIYRLGGDRRIWGGITRRILGGIEGGGTSQYMRILQGGITRHVGNVLGLGANIL